MVWHLSLRWRRAVDRAVEPLGLTHAQYIVLATLQGMLSSGAPPTQRQVAVSTGLQPIYVSKLLRTLEAEGFVSSERDGTDGRALRTSMTRRGTQVIGEAIRIVRELDQQLTASLGDHGAELATFRASLIALLSDRTTTVDDESTPGG
jgi:DNA-binding MarR family transcriptional regulator